MPKLDFKGASPYVTIASTPDTMNISSLQTNNVLKWMDFSIDKDGKVGFGGCIYCSKTGSGEFAGNKNNDLITQFNEVKNKYYIKEDKSTHINWINLGKAFSKKLEFFKGVAALFTANACHTGVFPVFVGFKYQKDGLKKLLRYIY